jgi:hypothetical protein
MRSNRVSWLLALLTFVVLGFPSGHATANGIAEEVDVLVPIRGGDVAAAREEAIRQAHRLALRQHLGQFRTAEDLREYYLLVEPRLERRMNRLIYETTLLEEKVTRNFYHARFRVSFVDDAVQYLSVQRLLLLLSGEERIQTEQGWHRGTDVLRRLRQKLVEAGLSPRILEKPLDVSGAWPGLPDDVEGDLVLTVEAVSEMGDDFAGFKGMDTRLAVRLFRALSGTELYSRSWKAPRIRAIDPVKECRSPIDSLADVAAEEVLNYLLKNHAGLIECELYVRGLHSYEEALALGRELVRAPVLTDVQLTAYVDGLAEFRVRLDGGDAGRVAEAARSVSSPRLRVLNMARAWVEAEVK